VSEATSYRAFISYSHRDERFARWLHRALETYRIPKNLTSDDLKGGSTLSPIFRDREEFPAATDLTTRIREALDDSEYLIVLCSPAAVQSRWVNEEIRTFRGLGKGDRILAMVVDGEPPACFPEMLRQDAETGRVYEHIAADARKQGDGRKEALLKIVAGMLSVGLDDIRQREQRRYIRRLTAIAATAVLLTLFTSALAGFAFVSQRDAERRRDQSENLIGFMVGDLRTQLKSVGRLDILRSVGDKALEYFASLDASDATSDVLLRRGQSLHQLGEVYLDLGQWDSAIEAFAESLIQIETLHQQNPTNTDFVFELSQAEYWMGNAYMVPCRAVCPPDHQDYERVAQHWQEYRRWSERLHEIDPNKTEWSMEVAWAHNNLGALNFARRRLEAAIQDHSASAEIFVQLIERAPDSVGLRSAAANAYMGAYTGLRETGNVPGALEYAEQAVAVAIIPPNDAGLRHRDARWQSYLAQARLDSGLVPEALSAYQEAFEKATGVSALDADNTVWTAEVARIAAALAEAGSAAGEPSDGTIAAGRKADDRLMATDDPFQDWRDLAFRYDFLEARSMGERTAREIDALLSMETTSPSAAVTFTNWALLMEEQQPEDVASLLENALSRMERARSLSRNSEVEIAYARILRANGRVEAATTAVDALLERGNRHPDAISLAVELGLAPGA
jgi:tetratricopeptide (TPR) repeat protein